MMQNYYKFFSWLKEEKGLTLIEILTATFIFLIVVIPLSGIYLSGAKTYMKTEAQSNLRSELDFVIADIMKKTQDASYFDLKDVGDENQKQTLINLFSNPKLGNLFVDNKTGQSNIDNLYTGLAVYSFQVRYKEIPDLNDSNKNDIQPDSTVINNVYQFQPGSEYTPFNYNHDNYLVYGLFQLDTSENPDDSSSESSTTNYKKLNLYLLIAPKSDNPLIEDGKPTSFRDLTDLINTVNHRDPPFESIRVIKTQITVNNIRQG
jgi:hypothetical protein